MSPMYEVLQDYQVPRLNGKAGAVWTEGSQVDLDADDAAWVNRDRAGTLVDQDLEREADEQALQEPEGESATSPAAEQAGGKPPRAQGRRRRDSAS